MTTSPRPPSRPLAGEAPDLRGPPLPRSRGRLSAGLVAALRGDAASLPAPRDLARADPLGDDLQLALYVLYELHYRGFREVTADAEWEPQLLALRAEAEARFLAALKEATEGGTDVQAALDSLQVEQAGYDGDSVSHYLKRHGTAAMLAEYAAVRSLYHLKEAEPHLWAVPRLQGRAKAALVAIEFDEFGAGRADAAHARLFADLMRDLDLDDAYGAYLDAAPAPALATVNMMSLFGLHRALRGALVGHFATVEITSPPGSRRLAQALRRAGAGRAAQRFYDEHVEADAVHEQVVRHEVVGGLLEDEPHLAGDIVFGVQATGVTEGRLARRLLHAWNEGRSALHGAGHRHR